MFRQLLQAPQCAIFAIINASDKRIYVSYTKDLQARLGTISSEILKGCWKYPLMVEDKEKLDVLILETSDERIFVKYFIDQYRNLGYTVYNEIERSPLEYRFGLVFGIKTFGVDVVAINKRNKKTILGRFKTVETATRFLEYVQRNNVTNNLIYAIK